MKLAKAYLDNAKSMCRDSPLLKEANVWSQNRCNELGIEVPAKSTSARDDWACLLLACVHPARYLGRATPNDVGQRQDR